MIQSIKIKNIKDLQALSDRASTSKAEIGVHDDFGAIADAKSIMGLLHLDYSKPVRVVCESENELRRVCRPLIH